MTHQVLRVKHSLRYAAYSWQETDYFTLEYTRWIKNMSDNLDCLPSQAKEIPQNFRSQFLPKTKCLSFLHGQEAVDIMYRNAEENIFSS
jgi:hypothetical protein